MTFFGVAAERPGGRGRMAVRRWLRRDDGFTLIELLVVIIIIAILAAIAIPTFLGQREKAYDTAAYTLVRNALTALQTAFVDTGGYTGVTVDALKAVETSIVWLDNGGDLVSTSPPGVTPAVVAQAASSEVALYIQSDNVADLASRSASGNWYGIQVDTVNLDESGYVKVKMVDGSADLGW
jgi:type IV pilus assembly protein PilA